MKDVMELHKALLQQKENIEKLMEEKEALIEACKEELNIVYEEFNLGLFHTNHDIALLVERVSQQVELFTLACGENVKLFEANLYAEHGFKMSENMKNSSEIEQGMIRQMNEEISCYQKYGQIWHQDVERIKCEERQNTRMIFASLDKDCMDLQIEMEEAKHRSFKNACKLNYNLNVLEKKNAEKLFMQNEQKRRLAKITGQAHFLYLKREQDGNKFEQEYERLQKAAKHVRAQGLRMSEKHHALEKHNWEKFRDMWNMNLEDGIQILKQLEQTDSIIMQQILMVPWKPFCGDVIDKSVHYLRKTESKECIKKRKTSAAANFTLEKKLLQHILEMIADRSGFLIKQSLIDILEPYCENKRLIKLTKIFEALKIKDLAAMQTLVSYFKPYLYCPTCRSKTTHQTCIRLSQVCDLIAAEADKSAECDNHYLVLEPTCVLTALNEFKKSHCERRRRQSNQVSLSTKDIEEFWTKVEKCMPNSKIELWKKMQHYLTYYLDILKKRVELHKQCISLKKINFELSHAVAKC